jgi:uncharacterized protein
MRIMNIKKISIGLVALCMMTGANNANASEPFGRNVVHVTGEHTVKAVPDVAFIDFTVFGESKELEEAKTKSDTLLRAVKTVLKELSIEDADVRTTGLRVQPSFQYHENGRRTLTSYEAAYDVHVQVHQLDLMGSLIQKLVNAGVDRIHHVGYALEHDESITRDALMKAMADARAKAALLAQAGGRVLGNPTNIQEQPVYQASPIMAAPMLMKSAGAEMGYAADASAGQQPPMGTLDVKAQVIVIYELKD